MITSAIVRELVAAGLSGEALVAALERIEASTADAAIKSKSDAAIRQARYRQRQKQTITSDVTRYGIDSIEIVQKDDKIVTSDVTRYAKEKSPIPPKENTTTNLTVDCSSPPLVPPLPISKPKTKGHRLPDDFEPDASCHELAETLLLTNQQSQDALREFFDYWGALPGQKACKLDWQATFRNHLRRVAQQRKPRQNGHNRNSISGSLDIVEQAIRAAEREAARAQEGIGSGQGDPFQIPRLRQVFP